MFGLGWQEVILILLLALLLFGAKRLPEIAKSLGRSVQEFKKGMNPDEKNDEGDEAPKSEDKKNETGNETKTK